MILFTKYIYISETSNFQPYSWCVRNKKDEDEIQNSMQLEINFVKATKR